MKEKKRSIEEKYPLLFCDIFAMGEVLYAD